MAYTQTPGREKLPPGNNIPDEFKTNNEPPVTPKVKEKPKTTVTPSNNPNTTKNVAVKSKAILNSNSEMAVQQAGFDAKSEAGYSGYETSQARKTVAMGTINSGGSSFNFITGEEKVAPYGFNYTAPKNGVPGKITNPKTNQLVKTAYGTNTNDTYTGSFKNPKEVLSEAQLYQSFVKDSVADQTNKRKNLAVLKNTKKVAGS